MKKRIMVVILAIVLAAGVLIGGYVTNTAKAGDPPDAYIYNKYEMLS